jgi:glucan phosphorylase
MAKLIIKLINCIARAINQDPLASSGSQGGVPAGLQRKNRLSHLSRRGSVGTNLHGRQEASGTDNMKLRWTGQ